VRPSKAARALIVIRYCHSGGGVISSDGVPPASGRPLPSSRLIARTVISCSQSIWQDNRTPLKPLASRVAFSAAVIRVVSPSTTSIRQVVQRALPPHACKMSTFASSSIARTKRRSFGTSTVPKPSTVNLAIHLDYLKYENTCRRPTKPPEVIANLNPWMPRLGHRTIRCLALLPLPDRQTSFLNGPQQDQCRRPSVL